MNSLNSFTIVLWLSLSLISSQASSQNMYRKTLDIEALSELNSQFIINFVNQDTASHNKIIHQDFVCIQSSGAIMLRKEYLKEWAHGYTSSGYTSFSYTDEFIRVFGNVALVRSKTVYSKLKEGAIVNGNSVYTDTYLKENGKWLCIQAQITGISHK